MLMPGRSSTSMGIPAGKMKMLPASGMVTLLVLFLGVAVRRSLPHEETQEGKEGEENKEGEEEMVEEEGEEGCIVNICSEEGDVGVIDTWGLGDGQVGEGRAHT